MGELVLTKDDILDAGKTTRDRWLGVMSAFAVAWYIFNLMVFVMLLSLGENSVSAVYNDAQLSYLIATPFWVNAAHAAAIGAGLIGSAYLLLRRSTAYYWFGACLAALLIMMLDASLRGGFEIMGESLTGISLISFVIGIYLFWAAYLARNGGELSAT